MFHAGHLQAEIGAVLEPLYEAASEFGKLHGIHEVQLTKLAGPDRQAMYQRLAELAEQRLYDQNKALDWWGAALVEDPRWEHALEESERLAGETGAWNDMVAAYTRRARAYARTRRSRRADAAPPRARLRVRAARRRARGRRRTSACSRSSRRTPTRSPRSIASTSTPAMYDDLAEILRRRIEVVQDPDEQLELYFRRGAIFSDALGDLEQALACYTAVLEQESRNRRALEAIESIHFRREDWKQLLETYEKLIDIADADAEMADIYARMARICSDALNEEERRSSCSVACSTFVVKSRRPSRPSRTSRRARASGKSSSRSSSARSRSPRMRIRFRSTSTSVASGKRSSAASATHSMRGSPPTASTATTSRRCARWRGCIAPRRRGTSCRQTIRRIIDVGQLSGAINENETIELYAQLGQLEGDVLGRVDEAVDAWRRVDRDRPDATSARSRPSRRCSSAKAAGRSRSTCSRSARSSSTTRSSAARRCCRPPSTWEEKVEDLTRAAQVYERVRAADPANATASRSPRSDLPPAVQVDRARRDPARALGARGPTSRSRSRILNQVAKIYESEIGDQESAFYVLQAAFKRDYSHDETANELERLATATNRWQELLDEYTNRVNELEREDRGSAADLWVKIGRWYARAPQPPRVRDPLGAAGAAHRPGSHRCARRHGRAAAQAR